ncbi:RAxF-45 family protein [Bacillus manliponensis]|uniref:RAxF-45 family protein n=1 Tax=Bacillus manliponensis TaxID=574376 RepID=UPI003513F6F0
MRLDSIIQEINNFRTKGVNEMKRFLAMRTQLLQFLYICRAKFADVVVNGIRVSFFNNCIVAIKR